MACSMVNITFTSTSLLLTESRPLKAIVLVLLVEIFSPCLKVTVSSLCTEICSASPETAAVTWSSANRSVLMSLFRAVLIPLIPFSFHSAIIWDMCLLNNVGASDSLVELLYLLLSAVSK